MAKKDKKTEKAADEPSLEPETLESAPSDQDDENALEADATVAPDSQNLPEVKKGGAERIKDLTARVNIYLIAFIVILIFAIITIYVSLNRETDNGATITTQDLSEDEFNDLAQNESNVGDVNEVLTIEANATFNGRVLIKDSLDVAGPITIGGPLSLPGITVSGTSAFENVEVNNSLSILGDTSIQGSLTVNSGASIQGDLTIGGTLSANAIVTDSITFSGDIELSGHVDTNGPPPNITRGSSLGSGGTVSISGTDTSGTITLNTGSGSGAGLLATISFSSSFRSTPRVILSPSSAPAASLDFYVTRDSGGFTVRSTSTPSSSSTYVFDYWTSE